MDSHLDIGLLECLVGGGKSGIDLGLDRFCLIDQAHKFPQQDVPLFIHKSVPLSRKGEGVFRKDQISLGGECVRIHEIPSL